MPSSGHVPCASYFNSLLTYPGGEVSADATGRRVSIHWVCSGSLSPPLFQLFALGLPNHLEYEKKSQRLTRIIKERSATTRQNPLALLLIPS